VDRKTLRAGCEAASGGAVKPDAFPMSLDEECMQRRNNHSRCLQEHSTLGRRF